MMDRKTGASKQTAASVWQMPVAVCTVLNSWWWTERSVLASRQQYLFDKCLLLYVQSWTPDDGQKDRPKHVECHSKRKLIWYIRASYWFYYRNNTTLHCPMNVKRGFWLPVQLLPETFLKRKGLGMLTLTVRYVNTYSLTQLYLFLVLQLHVAVNSCNIRNKYSCVRL